MKAITATSLSICLLLASGSVLAQDAMTKDATTNGAMSKDAMKKDSTTKGAMSKDSMSKDSMAK